MITRRTAVLAALFGSVAATAATTDTEAGQTAQWFAIHDWHVRWLQQMSVGRDGLGRYTIVLDGTFVVMRPELPPSFVGLPYDVK